MNFPDKNLNALDRGIRGVLGVITIYFGLFGNELIGDLIVQSILVAFGIVNLISLASGWCIVYHFAGINTRAEQ